MITRGFVILDKPENMSSRRAGGIVARMFGIKKFGHIGTLDPMASGLLPIALGGATKMIPYVEEVGGSVKEYLFSLRFGMETTTLDITGDVVRENDVRPTQDDVIAAIAGQIGHIAQTPPAFSAVHIDGRRAYDLARAGREFEIPPRMVDIYALELLGCDGDIWHFRTRVSRGTYVRAIARDLAQACGAIATVTMIRRTESVGISIENAVKLDFLENLFNNGGDVGQYLMSADFGLGDIPVQNLDDKDAAFYRNGGFVRVDAGNGLCRVYGGDEFIGIGRVSDGVLCPKTTIL